MEDGQRQKKKTIQTILIIMVIYIIMGLWGIGCPIRFITGISCAGCGMTRAWLSVFQGNIAEAFHYHPLFATPVLVAFLLISQPHLNRYVFRISMGMLCAGLIIIYFIRILSPDNDIVTFKPLQGAICNLLLKVLKGSK